MPLSLTWSSNSKRASGLPGRNKGWKGLGSGMLTSRSGRDEKRLPPTAVQDLQTDVAGSCSPSRGRHYGNDGSGTYAGASGAPGAIGFGD